MIGGDLGAMMARHAQEGRVEGLFVRPSRREDVISQQTVSIGPDGLEGDHGRAGKRAVTLLQAEHIPVISALLNGARVDPADLRRNILVSGINLLALRKSHVRVGECVLYIHGPCPPCSRMEEAFGQGGYSAVRGHGGVYAGVVKAGAVSIGSPVVRCEEDSLLPNEKRPLR